LGLFRLYVFSRGKKGGGGLFYSSFTVNTLGLR